MCTPYLLSDQTDLLKDEAFAPRQKAFYVRLDRGETKKDRGILGWVPASRSNGRLEILRKWLVTVRKLNEKDADLQSRQILPQLWDYLTSL